MKKGLSSREKILLVILALMAVFAVYYYVFYIPTQEKISYFKAETVRLEDEIMVSEIKIGKLNMMVKELEAIKSGDMTNIKELPPYDNSSNVMNSLSTILSKASVYNVSFSGVTEKDGIVRRDITLNFSCTTYETAKAILSDIYNGDYRCLVKDLHITQSGGYYRDRKSVV